MNARFYASGGNTSTICLPATLQSQALKLEYRIMKKHSVCLLLFIANVIMSLSVKAADDSAYVLLAMASRSGMGSYEFEFENVDNNELIRVIDPAAGSRFGVVGSPYLLKEVPAGRYYLSAIYMVHDSDTQRIAQLRDIREYIEVQNNSISYIGVIAVEIEDRTGSNEVRVQHEPASSVLRAAVSEEADLFRAHEVFVVLPGSDPIPIDRNLLGL